MKIVMKCNHILVWIILSLTQISFLNEFLKNSTTIFLGLTVVVYN